jgi:hypothetical protein
VSWPTPLVDLPTGRRRPTELACRPRPVRQDFQPDASEPLMTYRFLSAGKG